MVLSSEYYYYLSFKDNGSFIRLHFRNKTKPDSQRLQDGTANPVVDSGAVSVCIFFRDSVHERLENM